MTPPLIPQEAFDAAFAAACEASPRESCGLFVLDKHGQVVYRDCKNLAVDCCDEPAGNFILDPLDYVAAEEDGEIIGVVHSHPDGFPIPSDADRSQCELWGMPWHIVSPHLGEGNGLWHSFAPCGYRAPLIGRTWTWGVHDCWALVRDFYQASGILLPDFERPDDPKAFLKEPSFAKLFRDADFRQIQDPTNPQPGDCLLMTIGRSLGLNHVGVFTREMRVLHHLQGRLSCSDLYGEGLRKATGMILRHVNSWQLQLAL